MNLKYISHSEIGNSVKFDLNTYVDEWNSRKYLYIENYIFFIGHNRVDFLGYEIGKIIILEEWIKKFQENAKTHLLKYGY